MLPTRLVLLADDDLEVRLGVAELLSPLGLEVLHAESGPEALEIALLRRAELNLLVLDVHMPGCTGLEVLAQLVDEVGQELLMPCIFYSGEATPDLEQRALDLGSRAFLRKPVQPVELRSVVMNALDMDEHPKRA